MSSRVKRRVVVVITFTILIGAVWLGWRFYSAKQEERFARELSESGALVFWEYQLDANGQPDPLVPAPGPKWLRSLFGRNVFADVVSVRLRKEHGDEQAEKLSFFPSIRELSLARTQVTDKGLNSVARLTELRRLELDATSITDDGLRVYVSILEN